MSAPNQERERSISCVEVGEPHHKTTEGFDRCEIGGHVRFQPQALSSYFFSNGEPLLYDALLVAAACEYCDRTVRRPVRTWSRSLTLRIPVHDVQHWNSPSVAKALHEAINFLTGDTWDVRFYRREAPVEEPSQPFIPLEHPAEAVLPFSEGMDSRAVAGLMSKTMPHGLVRVRLGSRIINGHNPDPQRCRFAAVPFKVHAGTRRFVESSVRSRGFKFSLISGLAAYLAKAGRVIVTESGQGAIGPSLITVGQAYGDYRNNPRFTILMERFIKALLGHSISYEFPRLWHTKAETLRQYYDECEEGPREWQSTSSCWMGNRQASVDHKRRQCGICAACLLRRMSVHAASLEEDRSTYIWEDLSSPEFEHGASSHFDPAKITKSKRDYAIAGALHLDHLATITRSAMNTITLKRYIFNLSRATNLDENIVSENLMGLLSRHEVEWRSFLASLGKRSFIHAWIGA